MSYEDRAHPEVASEEESAWAAPEAAPQLSVLLIEADAALAERTAEHLRRQGVAVALAHDGREGLQAALSGAFDAVVLELTLPKLDGLELCRALRARSDVPLLIASSQAEEADRVLGLELGADDYLAKPYSPREMLARVRAQVRRWRGQVGPSRAQVRVGALVLDPAAQRATLHGRELDLTTYEFNLLLALAERAGRVLGREQLMECVRGSAEEAFDRSVDVHICHLRLKLGDPSRRPRLLKTVRGVGYLLAAANEPG